MMLKFPRLPSVSSQHDMVKIATAFSARGLRVVPSRFFTMAPKSRVAILYQATDPPIIDGTRKPKKPGGYQDSGADIAYSLGGCDNVEIITPAAMPDTATDEGWCFSDTEQGIISALDRGATHLWANTMLFAQHPLQVSQRIARLQEHVRVVGQGPLLVDKYDDKRYVNNLLRKQLGLTLPRTWEAVTNIAAPDLARTLTRLDLPFPVVAKPIRGRGSYGVKVCHDAADVLLHATDLASQGLTFMLEEYLAGEEATVTVMPPPPPPPPGTAEGGGRVKHWALPIVTRFNHKDGVAPYSGEVAVSANSRALTAEEMLADHAYAKIMRECEVAAGVLGTTAPIRVDVRRFAQGREFAMFDVNMKPNMTGPGRPGRDDQASLTLLAANALGWNYGELLMKILEEASTLAHLRHLMPR